VRGRPRALQRVETAICFLPVIAIVLCIILAPAKHPAIGVRLDEIDAGKQTLCERGSRAEKANAARTSETSTIEDRSMTMTQILIVARDALILWVNLAVMPAELAFEAIEAELKRRGIDPHTRSSIDGA
jgi:hypothetical protein